MSEEQNAPRQSTDRDGKTHVDPALKEFATARQLEVIEALDKAKGNGREAAEALGVNNTTVYRSIKSLKKYAARKGYAPDHDMTHTVPDGFMANGVSSYYDKEGKLRGQWVKSKVDRERQLEIIKEVIESMSESVERFPPLPEPTNTREDLMNVYTMTDCHMGMLAWGEETGGADWDLAHAEKTLLGCFAGMINAAPAADTCVVAQLGDFLHYDGLEAVTPSSRHLLDADSRFGKLVAVAVKCLRGLVDMALAKHKTVHVLMAEGNHDIASSVWLRVIFEALYENEPRVSMIHSENPYYAMQFGKNMLFWHHGHKKSPDSLPTLVAAMHRKMWGDTDRCYAHLGDKHHRYLKEHPGIVVEQHGTLAPPDAYATRGGWMSTQEAVAITYHIEYGEACRNIITPAMVEGA